jgi:SAM-dependent methyltransferase
MAQSGFDVHALDRDPETIAGLRDLAVRLGLTIRTQLLDLETTPPPDLGSGTYDLILGFNYLHRPLMPAIREAVKPGGRVFYETFTRRQAERGHPRNPAFLLEAGELERLMMPLTILRSREGDIDGRYIASIVAERPIGVH